MRYTLFEQDEESIGGLRRTPSYLAFVLRRNQPVLRVELGQAAPLEAAITAWRQQIELPYRPIDQIGIELRRLVWEPIEPHLSGVHTVLISPDGDLTAIPWGALPDRNANAVLLERYAVGLVPHGFALLNALTIEPADRAASGTLLTVGGVTYGDSAEPATRPSSQIAFRSPALEGPFLWPDLPASRREVNQIATLAQSFLRPGPRIVSLIGTEASRARLLAELPQARWAHLATHGFFADPRFRSVLQLDESLFQRDSAERIRPAGRNPQVLSGLAMAGAGLTAAENADASPDRGILTAEAIASLPLHKLDLIVLSACDTGIGEVAGGEGCFGLQRAFATAGMPTPRAEGMPHKPVNSALMDH